MDLQRSPFLLNWNESQSIECNAQGIITNGTDIIWMSCKKYLARGRLVKLDPLNSTRVELRMELWNWHALKGPQEFLGNQSYEHIGDGDYVELSSDGSRELWFGIEDGSWPRVLPAAIVRYDAETLEYIDTHPHTTIRTMPFLAFHKARQIAYTANWTDNFGQLLVFDAINMTWANDNATIHGLPHEYYQHEIPFIQGSDMKDDALFLMVDDFKSTLVEIQMNREKTYGGQLNAISYLGLGHEREGIAIMNGWLLSFGNRWKSWEGNHYAQIVCVQLTMPMGTKQIFFIGIISGILFGFVISGIIGAFLWRQVTKKSNPSYVEVEHESNQIL
jgi:hypothetical protein